MKRGAPMKRTSMRPVPKPPKVYETYTPKEAPARELRMVDTRARLTVAVPKVKPLRSEPYRRLVAAFPCINCGKAAPSQCAHGPSLGRSIKCDDRLTFPLCATAPGHAGCHWLFDNYRLFGHEHAEKAAEWARRTRAAIIAAGAWPANLPRWNDDE